MAAEILHGNRRDGSETARDAADSLAAEPSAARSVRATNGNRNRRGGRTEGLGKTTNEPIEKIGEFVTQGLGRRVQGHRSLQRDGESRVASQRTTRTLDAVAALYSDADAA